MKVEFFEDTHSYISQQGHKLTSATTVLGEYKQPFDEVYWSLYKAIEKCLPHEFAFWKKRFGYDKIVTHWVQAGSPAYTQVMKHVALIRELWGKKREDACSKGTLYHKVEEDKINEQQLWEDHQFRRWSVCRKDRSDIIENPDFTKKRVITEALLYVLEWGWAGQADRVIQDGQFVDIEDFKTNETIKVQGFSRMQPPLQHLDDCNYIHYSLQLSLYGYMLEYYGYKVRNLTLLRPDGERIPVPYMKAEIKSLLP